jgi:hypothetical protein
MELKKRLFIIWIVMLFLIMACVGFSGTADVEVTQPPAQVPAEEPTELPTDAPTEVLEEEPAEVLPTATDETAVEAETPPEEVAPVKLLNTEKIIERFGDFLLKRSNFFNHGSPIFCTDLELIRIHEVIRIKQN